MLQRSIVLTFVCVAFCWPVAAGAGDPKTADEVIAKYIEAIGGRAKLDAVKSMRMTAKFINANGMEIPAVVEYKRPCKVRFNITLQGVTTVRAFDGQTGWFIQAFRGKTDPEKTSHEDNKTLKETADFLGPLVDYRDKGHSVEFVGKEHMEGSEIYRLKVTRDNGNVEYHFLDAEHFLPIKVTGKRKHLGSEHDYEITYGDYKEVEGLLLAHAVEERAAFDGRFTAADKVKVERIEFNVDLPDDRFVMPAAKGGDGAEKGG